MSRPSHEYRYVFRYVFGLMALVAAAAIGVIASMYLALKSDREAHDRVTFFHVESTAVAQRLRKETGSLLRQLGYDIPAIIELAQDGELALEYGPDTRGTLQMIVAKLSELRELNEQYGGEEFAATLDRMEDRYRSVEYSIFRGDPAEASRRAILLFDLSIEQFYRQHTIASDATHPGIDTVLERVTPYLSIIAAILFVAGTVSWVTMRLLRKSMERQVEAEHMLAENRERMHHLEKLESLGRLVGGVAHDFNNLLTAILGQAGLMLDKKNDERTQYGLLQIREAGRQAASLTQQLLNFSRPQSSQARVVHLNEQIRNIETILTRVIGEDVELRIDYGDNLDRVELDPGQLQQIIVNLAVNARDAMPDGGPLSIATENVTVDASHGPASMPSTGRYVKIIVSDTGVGMDKETLERVFEPYFTTKAMGRGTGLGLSTVYGIVTAAGGFIDVTSFPDAGARFDIFLPSSDQPIETPAEEPVDSDDLVGDEMILIVEDEAQIREFLRDGLKAFGYQVLLAADANEGVAHCDANNGKIDVILADVVLPGTNGAEFLAQARKLQPQAMSILMSGYTDDVLARTGIDEPDVPLIYKPFEVTDIARLIRKSLVATH